MPLLFPVGHRQLANQLQAHLRLTPPRSCGPRVYAPNLRYTLAKVRVSEDGAMLKTPCKEVRHGQNRIVRRQRVRCL